MKFDKLKRVIIKEEFIALTKNVRDAVLLNQMIDWSERVKDLDKFIEQEKKIASLNGEDIKIDKTAGWIYKTAEELADETMLCLSPQNIRLHIKKLVSLGYIDVRNNPKYKWDKTKQYRVNLNKIQNDLNKIGYQLSDYKIDFRSDDNVQSSNKLFVQENELFVQTEQNVRAIPEITSEITSESFKESKKEENQKEDKSKKKNKSDNSNSYEQLINEFTDDEVIKETIYDFIKMRKLIKAPVTDRALKSVLKQLNKLSKDKEKQIQILEQSIRNNWRDVFPLREERQSNKHGKSAFDEALDEIELELNGKNNNLF